jgi:hypothetical protein
MDIIKFMVYKINILLYFVLNFSKATYNHTLSFILRNMGALELASYSIYKRNCSFFKCTQNLFQLGFTVKNIDRALGSLGLKVPIMNPSNYKILVTVKNQPKEDLALPIKNWKTLKNRLNQLTAPYQGAEPKPYLYEGMCNGIALVFILKYLNHKALGFDVVKAAVEAAKFFKEGADFEAIVYQYAQGWFYSTLPTHLTSDLTQHLFYPNTLAFETIKATFSNISITYEISPFITPTEKPDGLYFVILGYGLETTTQKLKKWRHGQHTVSYIKQGDRVLFFDPNYGLFTHENPNCYFSTMKKESDDVFVTARFTTS